MTSEITKHIGVCAAILCGVLVCAVAMPVRGAGKEQAAEAEVAQKRAAAVAEAAARLRIEQVHLAQAQAAVGPVMLGGLEFASSSVPSNPDDQSFMIAAGDDAKVRRRLEDFNDLIAAGKWMQAFTVLEELSSTSPPPMITTDSGLIAPFPAFRRNVLEGIPAEGRKAFAVMFNPKANQLWEAAQVALPEEELQLLEELIDKYPLTDRVNDATQRLGDAYFEAGAFGRAIDAWSAYKISESTAPSDAAAHWLRLAMAAQHAGDTRVLAYAGEQIKRNYPGTRVRLGHDELPALEAFNAVIKSVDPQAHSSAPTIKFKLPREVKGSLIVEVVPEQLQLQIKQQALQRGFGAPGLSNLVNIAVIDDKVLVSAPGWRAAYTQGKDKPEWEQGQAATIVSHASRLMQYQMTARQSLDVVDGKALMTTTDFNRSSYTQMAMIDPKTGQERWTTAGNSTVIALGSHILHRQSLLAVTLSTSGAALTLNGINPGTGSIETSIPLGSSRTFASRGNYSPIKPAIAVDGDTAFVQTNDGALIAVDLTRGTIAWAMKYQVNIPMHIMQGNYQALAMLPHGNVVVHENLVITKDRMSNQLFAIDAQRKQVRWKVEVGHSAGFLGLRHGLALVGDGDITAYDAGTGRRVWWSDLVDTRKAAVLLTDDMLIAVDSDRLYVLSLRTGKILAFSEVEGLTGQPGNLALHDGTLYVVDGMRVLAFPLFDIDKDAQAESEPANNG